MSLTVVGSSVARVDAIAKVTGAAVYGVDVRLPGMLVGRTLRAGVPHARITRLDISQAWKVPGVRAIVTGRDYPRLHGLIVKDQPALAIDKVRYAGEVVAAVAAEDDEAAQEALDRIEVEYEELPGVFDVLGAMAPGAPLVHDDPASYERIQSSSGFTFPVNPAPKSNILFHFKVRKGDVEAGFREADLVVEDTFSTPFIQYAHLEPHAAVALYDSEGTLAFWTSTMGPHTLRSMLAELLDLPLSRVRVMTAMVGGAYGSKMYLRAINPAAALLALKVPNRPVRVAFDREDEFLSSCGRLPTVTTVKTGVKKNGTLVARKATIIWDEGAYADIGPIITRNASYCALGPYRLPHAWIDAYLVYTNRQPGGGFRGLGIPQVAWAGEQQMDRVARELGIDPLELRLRNIYQDGDVSITGERLMNVGVRDCLVSVAKRVEWDKSLERKSPAGWLRGRGLACILKSTLTPTVSFAVVKLNDDGSVEILTSAVEHGQGAYTVLSQMVAEELSVPIERIRCVLPDTSVTPYDRSSTSSRTTFHMGNAVRGAAIDVRNQLLQMAAAALEAHPNDLELRNGCVEIRGVPGRSLTYGAVMVKFYGGPANIVGKGEFSTRALYEPMDPQTGQSGRPSIFWMYSAHGIEVELDPETGQIRVTRIVSASDAGKAINPQTCIQQIDGSAIMGLGMTVMEETVFDSGRVLNPTFLDYKIPTTLDVPDTEAIIVESGHPEGPWGAKGLGESALASIPAAIGNAVYDAAGVQIKELPIRAEKVYRIMRETRAK